MGKELCGECEFEYADFDERFEIDWSSVYKCRKFSIVLEFGEFGKIVKCKKCLKQKTIG
jgi:hypothetical protein